jgi:hypothetical protein
MRSFVVTMAVCALLATGFAANALAVGVYVAGQEPCKCSPLVAAGIIPDALNNLAALPFWSVLNSVAERLAGGFQGLLNQTGTAPMLAAAEPEAPAPSIAAEEKKPVVKAKKKKARKIKRPPTAK